MKLTTLFSSLAILLAFFIVLAGYVSAQLPDKLAPELCSWVSHEMSATHDYQDIELGTCERGCRRRFGYETSMSDDDSGLVQAHSYWAYAQCIADCNSSFWKEFDRKAREIPRER